MYCNDNGTWKILENSSSVFTEYENMHTLWLRNFTPTCADNNNLQI